MVEEREGLLMQLSAVVSNTFASLELHANRVES